MINTTVKGKVKIVKLNRPTANALDLCFLNQLYGRLKEIEKDKQIQGVVLASENVSVFSSGLDLKSLTSTPAHPKVNIIKAVWAVRRIVKLITRSRKVYTAALSGAVIGSAVSIVLACDFRFSSKSAWFWLPDPQYGGLLADGGIDLIKSICGTAGAKKCCLTSERIDSDCASRMGLIHEILKQDILEDHACYYTSNIINHSKTTFKNTKRIINTNILKPFHWIKLLRVVHSKEMLQRLNTFKLLGGTYESAK